MDMIRVLYARKFSVGGGVHCLNYVYNDYFASITLEKLTARSGCGNAFFVFEV